MQFPVERCRFVVALVSNGRKALGHSACRASMRSRSDGLDYSRPAFVNIARILSHNSIRTPFLRMTMLC